MNKDSHLIYENYQKTLKKSLDSRQFFVVTEDFTPIDILFKGTYDECMSFMKRNNYRGVDLMSEKDGKPFRFVSWHLTPIVTESSITTPTKYWIRFDHMSMANKAAMLLHGNHNYQFKQFTTYLIPDSPEDFEKIKQALDQNKIEYTTPYHYGDTVMESSNRFPSANEFDAYLRKFKLKEYNSQEEAYRAFETSNIKGDPDDWTYEMQDGKWLIVNPDILPGHIKESSNDFPSSSEMHGDVMVDSDKNTFEKLMAKIAALLGPENGSPAAQQSIMKGAPNKKVPPQHPPLEQEHRGPSYGS